MSFRARIGLLLLSALFVSPSVTRSQTVPKKSEGLLSTLKPGHWIQLEGTTQKDKTVLCTEVKQLTGDFLDDDWSLRGLITSKSPERREIRIADFTITVTDGAIFDLEGMEDGFEDLKPGMLVEVEGKYRRDGTFLAEEVDDESDKLAKKHGIEQRIRIVGKVERVDVSKQRVTAMGHVFQITDKTQMKSTLR